MSRLSQTLLLVAVLVVTALGFGYLFSLRVSQGDIFPPYSTLRADPLGTRALHDSLADLPGMQVDRLFQPVDEIPVGSPRTIIFAGLRFDDWTRVSPKEFAALDAAVRGGSRLVLAMQAGFEDADWRPAGKKDPKEAPPSKADAPAPRGVPRLPGPDSAKAAAMADLKRLWGIDVAKLGRLNYEKGAVLEPGARGGLPGKLRWESDIYFTVETGAPWRVVYRALGKPVLLETPYGRGSIVVASDAYLLSNEGLLNDRSSSLLSWIIGPNTRVEFDESHLGVVEEVGIASLARRFGMTYAAATLLLLAVLFIWKRAALFVPLPQESAEATLDCSHTAALEALLLRSVPPSGLMDACAAEWRGTARPSAIPRLEAVLAAPHARAPEAYNEAVRALRRR